MNSGKKVYEGWVLCPSTRFLGKFYYFNPATGEAVWNVNDMERRMSRPTFTNSGKWHTYPEPDSPPYSSNSWGYQPDFRSCHQPSFGQAAFPKYSPNPMENFMHMWGMPQPQPMYMNVRPPLPIMPNYEPMWGPYGQNPKHYVPENNFYANPYMQKVPCYNFDANRQVFGPKPIQNNMFPQNEYGDPMKKRRMYMDNGILKEPLFKRLKSQNELRNENLFRERDNIFQERSFESAVADRGRKPFKMPAFQVNGDNKKVCNCMSQENLYTGFSKSQENLENTAMSDSIDYKPNRNFRTGLSRSTGNLNERAPSEISSNFSCKYSFVFPLKKSESSKSLDNMTETVTKSKPVLDPGQNAKKVPDDVNSKLSATDLRYMLMEKRKKALFGKETETNENKGKKIRTSYSKDDNLRESVFKKHVTFDLGVEGSLVGEGAEIETDNVVDKKVNPEEVEDEVQPCFLVPDTEALLSEYELIENLAKSDPSYTLLVAGCVSRAVTAACGGEGGGHSVTAARRVSRRLAGTHEHIRVQSDHEKFEDGVEGILECCVRVYQAGLGVILITDNEELFKKAVSMEFDCYTTEEIRNWASTTQVSFDIKKTEQPPNDEPEKNMRNNFFHNKTVEKQFFLNNEDDEENFDDRSIFLGKIVQNAFFERHKNVEDATKINRQIENLNLGEDVDQSNRRSKPQTTEKNDCFFKNEAKDENVTAKKKVENINVYNLEGLLKGFSIKTKDMESLIMLRMDEYYCCFAQIMETTLLDVLEKIDTVCLSLSESRLTPLQGVLQHARAALSDHRTVRLLADRLAAVLDTAHVLSDQNMFVLRLTPKEFVKLFGCGTLLIKVLRNFLPSLECLYDGERLLEQLEGGMGRPPCDVPPPRAPPAACPSHAEQEHRPEYMKNPSEVLRFLTKHYPDYRDNKPTADNNKANSDNQVTTEVQLTTKVIRTTGRHIGLLNLNPKKPLILNNKETLGEDYVEDKKTNNKNESKSVKAKAIKKLAVESLNLPPKMREIDVEKRERVDKEISMLLNQMVTCTVPSKPLTKLYNLKSVIVDKNDIHTNNENGNKSINKRKGTPEKEHSKSNDNIDSTTKDVFENSKISKTNDNKLRKSYEPLNLDALDYSDIDETDSIISSVNQKIVESDNSNQVTTTQHDNYQFDNANDIIDNSKENTDETNEISDNINYNDNLNENNVNVHEINDNVNESNDNSDSGIESFQAFIPHIFMTLSATFRMVQNFIESSMMELNKDNGKASRQDLNCKADTTRALVDELIAYLNHIIERESNPATSVVQLLMKDTNADCDKRITRYSLVVCKCVSTARILRAGLGRLGAAATRYQQGV